MADLETKPAVGTADEAASQVSSLAGVKRSPAGIVLVPQPSDDPKDPLNWSMGKKIRILAIASLSAFVGIAQSLANQSGIFVQAAVYHKTGVELSYSISAATVGLAVGPFIWTLLSQVIGRSSCIFWGMLGTLACGIWSAQMTGTDQYVNFVISRWLGGTFGSCAATIGAGFVLDMFFLHQRGKAFACYTLCTLFGTQVAPTLGGFIVESAPWPVQFWWTVGLEGLMAIIVFLFLEETTLFRDGKVIVANVPQSWLMNRVATFLPGTRVAPRSNRNRQTLLAPFLIAICPVTLLAGSFLLIAFGWAVAVTTLIPVFLQTPVEEGGYGFTPMQVSLFTFAQWVGIIAAEIYGMLFNDRVPLWFCRRYHHGVWKPEHRLYPLLLPPAVILPSALGLYGAGLQYHLHYMVLAVAVALINFCEIALIPVTINYVVECFTGHASEVTTVLNFFRLVLGLTVPFFIDPWEARVGPGWVFGMMAFFSLFAFSLTGVLARKGDIIRQYSIASLRKSEDGTKLVREAD